jgi:glycine hydroxymethyltransferase
MKEAEMAQIAKWIGQALEHRGDDAKLKQLHGQVSELAESFPLYGWLRQPEGLAEPEVELVG